MARKMHHCFNCGEPLGEYSDYDPLDTCGAIECEYAAMEQRAYDDAEAREKGWLSNEPLRPL